MALVRALNIHVGPMARRHIERFGLQPGDIATIPGAAGGPKGLILGPLDRFIFGRWLSQTTQSIDLVGASIGAWRMATACLDNPVASFQRFEHDYIHQHYELKSGEKRPSAAHVSAIFGQNLQSFFGGRVGEVLNHPRFRLHIMTTRGRHILRRENRWRTPVGYLGAIATNTVSRRALGIWLERVVFSGRGVMLPFSTRDFRTCQVPLDDSNFKLALQASCSIPFVLQAIHNIPGAPRGAYWDGGLTDYHLHLNYAGSLPGVTQSGLVLYPHFQKSVVPGWFDKGLKWRHKSSSNLDNMVLLAPNPDWVRTLPNGKLPDRTDFTQYSQDFPGRVKAWNAATSASGQLADEFEAWLLRPDPALLQPL